MASIFLYLSFDEGSRIHELAIYPIRRVFGDSIPSFLYFAWVIPAIPIMFILTISYFKFFFKLPKHTRRMFLISVILYLSGALGFEMIGGHYASINGVNNLGYSLITTVEESFEMAGNIVFINALMKYIEENFKEVVFLFKK